MHISHFYIFSVMFVQIFCPFFTELYEFFAYSGYKFSVRKMYCNSRPTSDCGLPFSFLITQLFKEQTLLIFIKFTLSFFFFLVSNFCILVNLYLHFKIVLEVLFSFQNVFSFNFYIQLINYLELIFMCGVL